MFIFSYFRNVDITRRKQLRPILISIIVGISAFAYFILIGYLQPFAIFLKPYLLLPGLLIAAVPFAFGYSIFHHRLMDIDLIIKRSIIYGAVTALLAAFYILFVFGIGSIISHTLGQSDNQTLSIIAFLIIAFMFDPVKQKIQAGVDKLFYRERYDYQKALLEFSRELPSK